MFLKTIKMNNFRNYEKLEVEFNPYINIIYGNNAQGKTNLLESIYYLALSKSYSSFIDLNIIKNEETYLYVKGIINEKNNDTIYEIGLDQNKKKLKIDNNQIKKVSDYISKINIIIFFPEDLNLIKGSPKERRRFLNSELSQLNSNYVDILTDYNRLLKMRNNYLKNYKDKTNFNENYLEILTEYLINKACDIYISRKKFIDRINEYSNKIFKDIIKMEGYEIIYEPNIRIDNYEKENVRQILKKEYKKSIDIEMKIGSTIIGPHKDEIKFYLNKEDLKSIGSQGQQRVAILALKLAELKVFEKYNKKKPILLLDDVFSELDKRKRNSLIKYLKNKNQVIITTTDLNLIDDRLLKGSKRIKIKEGKIIKVEG